jgi:hypothetical protein
MITTRIVIQIAMIAVVTMIAMIAVIAVIAVVVTMIAVVDAEMSAIRESDDATTVEIVEVEIVMAVETTLAHDVEEQN